MTAARPSNYAALIRKTIWTRSRRCIKGSQRSVAASPAGHQVQLSWTTCCCCKTGSDTAATANWGDTILYLSEEIVGRAHVDLPIAPKIAERRHSESWQDRLSAIVLPFSSECEWLGFGPSQSWPGRCARHIHSAQRTSIPSIPSLRFRLPFRFVSIPNRAWVFRVA